MLSLIFICFFFLSHINWSPSSSKTVSKVWSRKLCFAAVFDHISMEKLGELENYHHFFLHRIWKWNRYRFHRLCVSFSKRVLKRPKHTKKMKRVKKSSTHVKNHQLVYTQWWCMKSAHQKNWFKFCECILLLGLLKFNHENAVMCEISFIIRGILAGKINSSCLRRACQKKMENANFVYITILN